MFLSIPVLRALPLLLAGLLPTPLLLAQTHPAADSIPTSRNLSEVAAGLQGQLVSLDGSQSLSEVTVTASRLDQRSRETGRNVTIIPGAELSRFPVNSLDDLLRCLPSLEVQSRGSFGAQADITLRGSTFNQVLILLDGQRLNDPLTGHFNSYFPIAPAEIAQIEIVRGPGSALYGPDAVGGIIHIVTKTFAARRPTEQLNLQATGLRGEWKLWHVNAGGFAQTARLRVGGGVLLNKTQGQPREAPSTGRNDLNLRTYSLSASYDLTSKLSVAARAAFDRRDFDAQYFYSTFATDLSRERTTRDFVQAQLRFRPRPGQQTELQVAHSYSTDYYAFTPAGRPNEHETRFTNAQLHHTQALGNTLKLGAGGQYDDRRIQSNNQGNHQTAHYGLYSLLAYSGVANLTATGSLRFDHDAAYGSQWIPQLNLSYAPVAALVLRGGVGRSVRAASFTERYYNYLAASPLRDGSTVGLASLQAERATTYELGADYSPWPQLTFKATAFARDGHDLIDYVLRPGPDAIRQTGLANLQADRSYNLAQNLRSVRTQGLETELWGQAPLGAHLRLEAVAGYTYLTNASPVVSQYLGSFARHLVSGTLTLRASRYGSFTLSGLYKQRDAAAADQISRRLTADYAVFNARLEAAVLPKRVFVVLQAQNLFDAQYADLLGAQMPGRWLMGGLRLNY
ncbi:TonB-dependent receptor plug domain-containing protein [uncultured Hymenobacter sp.]|uniref:TonB-dependent receptor plug domain-containing protein n=1 Tax=uncultured Hymenobacter sp. TaxID=170016 RepID=UPI0035CA3795